MTHRPTHPQAGQGANSHLIALRSHAARRVHVRIPVAGVVRLSIVVVVLATCFVTQLSAYSVLTHEAIVDAAWKNGIQPVLLARFPNATVGDLRKAHAYAYGGAIIQDLGYYPFGNRFFSDLTHYVRSGDFVIALVQEARDLNEYAFALGALAHYAADNSGHQLATNRAVAIMYPQLAKKHGPAVPYEVKPSAHMNVEFGFDVDQVVERNYAPQAYHEFIGFEVSKPVLERAFEKTYGLKLSEVFGGVDLVIGSYRRAVSKAIPRATKVAWQLKKKEFMNSEQNPVRAQYIYHISNSEYRKEWGHTYETPGPFARFKALLLRLLPKVGPLRAYEFHPPPPAVEQLYMQSFNETMNHYLVLLTMQHDHALQLQNDNLDTGGATLPASYDLADETYAKLLKRTSGREVPEALRRELLSYYADLQQPFATKRHPKDWREVMKELEVLKSGSAHQPGL